KIASNLFLRSSKVLLVYQVHLVQDDQGGNIPPVPGQHVNQLLVCDIFAYQNAAITNPVGFDYSLDSCRGQFRKLDTGGESEPSLTAPIDDHIGRLLVDPNTHRMKLILQQLDLPRLKHIQDQQYEVRVPGDRENSPSPPSSRRCTADDSWKVEDLNVRSVETQNP